MANNTNRIGREEIRDKAISFEKIDTNLQGKINTIGTGNLNTQNKTLIPAINELFQSGVDIQNIAKSALNAAGISYSDNQLRTLVNTMGNNLYTQAMHSSFVNNLNSATGNNTGSINNSFNDLVNMIIDIKGKDSVSIGTVTVPNDAGDSPTIDLGFAPTDIMCIRTPSSYFGAYCHYKNGINVCSAFISTNGDTNGRISKGLMNCYEILVTGNTFKVHTTGYAGSLTFNYIAISDY